MWYFFSLLIIVISVLLGTTGCFQKSAKIKINPLTSHKSVFDSSGVLLSKQQIKEKLELLANSTPPTDISFGAMCYEVVVARYGPRKYICPVCGAKTLYNSKEFGFIDSYIQSCREMLDSLTAIDITLDERQYCKKCSPDIKDPSLCIEVRYPNDTTVCRTCSITSDDLIIINDFLKGRDKHKTFNDAEIPLKNYLLRLEELLGIPLEENK